MVQCQYANRNTSRPLRFFPSAMGTQLNRPRTGDDFSGWNIEALDVFPFNFTESVNELVRTSGTTYSHPNDPWPLNPQNTSVEPFESILWTEGFDVVIEVRRISLYFVIVAILPIAVNVWLCLLVFFISPKHLDTRIGICVTMFLALTAIQFVIASVLPSSSTVVPTQQLIILSYAVMALIAIMSIIVYFISVADRRKEKKELTKQARTHFTRRWTTFVKGVGTAAVSVGSAAASEVSLRCGESDTDSGESDGANRPKRHTSVSFQGQSREQERGRKAATRPPRPQHPIRSGGEVNWQQESEGRSSTRFGGVGVCTPSSDESTDDSEADKCNSYKSSGGEAGGSQAARRSSQHSAPAALPPPPAAILTDKQERRPRGASSAGGNSSRRRLPGGDAQGSSGAPSHDMESGQQQQGQQAEGEDKGVAKMRVRAGCAWGSGWWRQLWLAPVRWFRLQHLKFKEMAREAQTNKEYATFLAQRTDRATFWIVVVGYNISIVIIFVIGASKNPTMPAYPNSTIYTT